MSSMISDMMPESMRWPSAHTSSYGPLGMPPAFFLNSYAVDDPFYANAHPTVPAAHRVSAALGVADTSATPPSAARAFGGRCTLGPDGGSRSCE